MVVVIFPILIIAIMQNRCKVIVSFRHFPAEVEWACAKFGGRVILSHLFFKTITLSDNLYKNNAMHDDNEFEGMVVVSRK